MSGGVPVYLMMRKEEHYDIILSAMVDLMMKSLRTRAARRLAEEKDVFNRKTLASRMYSLTRTMEHMEKVENSYEGCLPEELSGAADELEERVREAITAMLNKVKED